MGTKNNIKIDSFEVTRMYLADIPEVLKLAASNQASFKIHPSSTLTCFLSEMSNILQKNTRLSFVFRKDNQIFAAFIIQPQTSKSINFLYSIYDKEAVNLIDLAPRVLKKFEEINIDIKYAHLLKANKNSELYQIFLKKVGFKNIFNENDTFVVFSN